MKKTIIIIIFFLLSFPYHIIADVPYPQAVIALATNFLNNLQAKEISKLKDILSKNIQFKNLTQEKFLSLADEMMTGKIPISEYIINVTGHNVQNFLNDNFQLVQFDKCSEYGIDRNIDDKKINGNFYYIKFKITYKDKNKIINNKTIEIDIINENNQLKIFGFII